MIERKNICPTCGKELLVRQGDRIICLNHGCDFYTEAKREGDRDIPDFNIIKKMWQ